MFKSRENIIEELDAFDLHENYKQRSTSETWIAEVKGQLLAGSTFTNNFNANDILWRLGVFSYNLSVLMRYKIKKILETRTQYF